MMNSEMWATKQAELDEMAIELSHKLEDMEVENEEYEMISAEIDKLNFKVHTAFKLELLAKQMEEIEKEYKAYLEDWEEKE